MKRRIAIVLAGLAAVLLARAGMPARAPAPPALATLPRSEVRDGVWIWTRADADVFAERGAHARAAMPGVLVLSIDADGSGALSGRRGLAPSTVEAHAIAAVVRIEDAVAPRLDDPIALAAELDARLASLRAELTDAGVHLAEVQLDFDVPVRRLAAWADVTGRLAKGSLAGIPVWITSIPAHLGEPRYGALFSGAIAGHVHQTFDTGLACSPSAIARTRERLERASLPFRMGVATFERSRGGARTTDHTCWANATRRFADATGYAGAWVFPAGRSIEDATWLARAE